MLHAQLQLSELYRQKAAQKQVNISLDIDPSVPAWVLIDSGKLSQVLNNLLSNAVKFTTQGTIRVLATYTSAMLKIAVTDTGVGTLITNQSLQAEDA